MTITDSDSLPPDGDPKPKYRWGIVDVTLEEHAEELEKQGYILQWLGEHIVRLIPPDRSQTAWIDGWLMSLLRLQSS